jgi:hypothetical protein
MGRSSGSHSDEDGLVAADTNSANATGANNEKLMVSDAYRLTWMCIILIGMTCRWRFASGRSCRRSGTGATRSWPRRSTRR